MYGPNGDGGASSLAYTGAGLTIAGISVASFTVGIICAVLLIFGYTLYRVSRRR